MLDAIGIANDFSRRPSEQLHVLMIEDDDHYYKMILHLLSTYSEPTYKLTRVSCLAQAIDYLSGLAPDVILLDLNLPDGCGLSVLQEVQGCSQAPVIVLTSSAEPKLGLQSIAKGASDFLVKQKVGTESIVRCIRYAIERRKAEESRLRLLAIHDFIATLAHDLQIPMIGADKVLDALLITEKHELTSFQLESLRALKESNTNQLALVQKLIEIYKYESGDRNFSMKPVDLRPIIVSSTAKRKDTAEEKTILIEIKIAASLRPVWADPEAISCLVSSLVDNALKFASQGSTVSILAENQDSNVLLQVKNFGPVISPEERKELFDRFWQGVRGKKYVANIGLGLYQCHQIVRFHQGRIECSSSSDNGTTFSVTIPAF